MIFTVKHDLRHKSRLFIGVHFTDASMYDTYASVVKTNNIRLFFKLAVHLNLISLTGDVGTAYLNAMTEDKIFYSVGPEFKDK